MKNEKMVGKPPSSSQKQQPAPPHRKSRWESTSNPQPPPPDPKSSKSKPSPSSSRLAALDSSPIQPPLRAPPAGPSSSSAKPPLEPTPPLPLPAAAASPFQLPDLGPPPPPPPAYGFHMLERRTIVLADGSVRSYFALPPEEGFPLGGFGPETGGLLPGADRPFRPPHPLSPDGLLHRGEFHGRGGGPHDYWSSLGLDGRGPPPQPESSQKRKYGEEDARDGYGRQRQQLQQLLQYGNPNGYTSGSGDRADYMARPGSPRWREAMNSGRSSMDDMRPSKHTKVGGDGNDDVAFLQGMPSKSNAADYANTKHLDVNPDALKRAFLRFSKLLNEHVSQRNNYLENGKNGPLRCLACDRDSKDYGDLHALIIHAYNSQNAALRVDHLGFHKAVCILMGWNYAKVPDNSKAYQSLSANEAAANKEDLIIWPPVVIIHNTNTGRRKDGRVEGLGNKEMDNKLKELGFTGGKSKSVYGRDGHTGITVVKFASSHSGLKDAERLADYFEKENHGRSGWAHAQASRSGEDEERNPNLVKADEKTGEKNRIFYGYLGTSSDLDKVDFDIKKRAIIKSKHELDPSD